MRRSLALLVPVIALPALSACAGSGRDGGGSCGGSNLEVRRDAIVEANGPAQTYATPHSLMLNGTPHAGNPYDLVAISFASLPSGTMYLPNDAVTVDFERIPNGANADDQLLSTKPQASNVGALTASGWIGFAQAGAAQGDARCGSFDLTFEYTDAKGLHTLHAQGSFAGALAADPEPGQL